MNIQYIRMTLNMTGHLRLPLETTIADIYNVPPVGIGLTVRVNVSVMPARHRSAPVVYRCTGGADVREQTSE